ncbi:5-formyltetrahydrofolate cyclo-ligase [Endozoicomonadaceae bacterium StTr2]
MAAGNNTNKRAGKATSKSSPQKSNNQKRKELRQKLRTARRSLTREQQHKAAHNLTRRFCSDPAFMRSNHIGLYLVNDGEINPIEIAKKALACGKKVYLPVLHPFRKGHLLFLPWTPSTPMRRNRFGILEPDLRSVKPRPVWSLDLVLMPLTGFDKKGNRLGMGGGFYDRTFSFKQQTSSQSTPVLIGLAHECQKVSRLPVSSWDVPTHAIYTDVSIYPSK